MRWSKLLPTPHVAHSVSFTSQAFARLRAVLIEQLFSKVSKVSSFFFQVKQEKQEKQVTFPKNGNLTEGKILGRLRITIFGNKICKIWKYKKLREKNPGNLDKASFDKNCYRVVPCYWPTTTALPAG